MPCHAILRALPSPRLPNVRHLLLNGNGDSVRRTTTVAPAEVHDPCEDIILTRARQSLLAARTSLRQFHRAEGPDASTETRLDELAAMLDLRRAELLLLRAGPAAWDVGATTRSDAWR